MHDIPARIAAAGLALALFLGACQGAPQGDGTPSRNDLWTRGESLQSGTLSVSIPPRSLTEPFACYPLEPLFVETALADSGLEIISESFEVKCLQPLFLKPLRLSLGFDPAKLPKGTRPEQIVPIFTLGQYSERLPARRVDLVKGLVEFDLDRAVPLVDACGSEPQGIPQVAVAVNRSPLVRLELGPEGDYSIWGADADLLFAGEEIDLLKTELPALKRRFSGRGFEVPPFVEVSFSPLDPRTLAQAWGGRSIQMNSALLADPKIDWRMVLTHEYFHLVQQRSAIACEFDPRSSERSWLAESTAEWMASRDNPKSRMIHDRTTCLTPEYFFSSLFTCDKGKAGPPQYLSMIFWSFLASHYDVEALLKRIYEPRRKPLQPGRVDPVDLRSLLSELLSTTPDHQGRRRSLEATYADFVLHAYWIRDFEPVASGFNPKVMGPKLAIRNPRNLVLGWNIPGTDNRRTCSGRFEGEEFSIIRAVQISSMGGAGDKGDLEIRLSSEGFGSDEARSGMLIVLPFKKGIERPLFGSPKAPVVIKSWQDWAGALVWIIDLSPPGRDVFTLTASFAAAPPEPENGWLGLWEGKVRIEHVWNDPDDFYSNKATPDNGKTGDFSIEIVGSASRWRVRNNSSLCPAAHSELSVQGNVLRGSYRNDHWEVEVEMKRSGDTITGWRKSKRAWVPGGTVQTAWEHENEYFQLKLKQ